MTQEDKVGSVTPARCPICKAEAIPYPKCGHVTYAEQIEDVASITNVFDTRDEAIAFRKKLRYPEQYGVYGMCQSKEKQLWVAMPLTALKAMWDFKVPT